MGSCSSKTTYVIKTREILGALREERKLLGATRSSSIESSQIITTDVLLSMDEPFKDVTVTAPPKEDLYALAKTLQESLESDRDLILLGASAPGLSASNSQDLLSTASPIFGYNAFEMGDDQLNSISSPEEDDYGLDHSLTDDFRNGISNINYDFDVSDHSAEDSVVPQAGRPQLIDLTGGDLVTNKTLIEDSPMEDTLPSPLLPITVVKPGSSSTFPDENLFVQKS